MIKKLWNWAWSLVKTYWKYEVIRFLFVGGINTVFGGFLIPFLIRQAFGSQSTDWNLLFVTINIPITLGYLIWFTPAYFLQVYVSFQTQPALARYAAYPFTQIPNYALQQLTFYLVASVLVWPDLVAYALSAILPIPIMFILVRFIVKGKWLKSKAKIA